MDKKLILLFFIITICGISCFLFTKKSHADNFSIGIYPPLLQIQAKTPTIITKNFTIVNASDSEENMRIVFRQFQESPANNGQVNYLPTTAIPSPDAQIFNKIQILDNGNPILNVNLAPKQKKDLMLRIGLPATEEPADYYFSILFVSSDLGTNTANGTHITAGIATNVLLSIEQQGVTTGFLQTFSAPLFDQTGPIPFTIAVQNTSSHFIAPTGQVLIRNMFGQLIGQVKLLPVNILAYSTRYIPSKENKSINGHPVALWNETALFGPYRANVVISLSPTGPIFTRIIYFFVMPWEYIVALFFIIVIVTIVVNRVRTKMRNDN